MTDPRPEKVTVTLTAKQRDTLLMAMRQYLLDSDRYNRSFAEVGDEPAPHQSCCEYHLAQWRRDTDWRDVLAEQRARHQAIISLLETAQPAPTPSGSKVIALSPDAVRDEIHDAFAHGNPSYGHSQSEVDALCALPDDAFSAAIDAVVDDRFWAAFDEVRNDAIAVLTSKIRTEENP